MPGKHAKQNIFGLTNTMILDPSAAPWPKPCGPLPSSPPPPFSVPLFLLSLWASGFRVCWWGCYIRRTHGCYRALYRAQNIPLWAALFSALLPLLPLPLSPSSSSSPLGVLSREPI